MSSDWFEGRLGGEQVHVFSWSSKTPRHIGLSIDDFQLEMTSMECFQLIKGLQAALGEQKMVESDKHEVLCTIANIMYNDGGSLKGTSITDDDVGEMCNFLNSEHVTMCCRRPTKHEVYEAMTILLEAEYVG
jgi:hypothetical protein